MTRCIHSDDVEIDIETFHILPLWQLIMDTVHYYYHQSTISVCVYVLATKYSRSHHSSVKGIDWPLHTVLYFGFFLLLVLLGNNGSNDSVPNVIIIFFSFVHCVDIDQNFFFFFDHYSDETNHRGKMPNSKIVVIVVVVVYGPVFLFLWWNLIIVF